MDYKDVLIEYAGYFEQSDVASNVLRWIGWKLIMMLHTLCDFCQGLWDSVFQVFDFTEQFADRLGDYYEIWYAVLLVAILAVGTMYLLSEKRPPFVRNLVITAAVVTLLPGGVRTAGTLLQIEKQAYMADGESVADTTIIVNTVDLLYQKENGWSFSSPNCLSGATIKYIDANETVEKKTAKAFKYYKRVDESTGSVSFKEIKKGFFGLLTPLYYRYSISFMAILAELIVNILVLIFASYRLFRMIWDMVYGELLAYIMSGDVASGEKTKQILQYMLNLFWGISIMIWGFAIWREFQTWVSAQNFATPIRILLIAFAGIAMVDGPDIVERVMGVDVGMKDGFMKTMGAFHLMQAGMQGAKGVGSKARNAAGTIGAAGKKVIDAGRAAEQKRMSKTAAQEPPGGAANPQGESDSKRREPPGASKQTEEKRTEVAKAAKTNTNEQSSQKQMNDANEDQKNSLGTYTADTASGAVPEQEMKSGEAKQASAMQETVEAVRQANAMQGAVGTQEPHATANGSEKDLHKQESMPKIERGVNEKSGGMNHKGAEKAKRKLENGEANRNEPPTKANVSADGGKTKALDKKELENKTPDKTIHKAENDGVVQTEPPRKNESGNGNSKADVSRNNAADKKNRGNTEPNRKSELSGKPEPKTATDQKPSQLSSSKNSLSRNPSMTASVKENNNYSAMPKNNSGVSIAERGDNARVNSPLEESLREGSRPADRRQGNGSKNGVSQERGRQENDRREANMSSGRNYKLVPDKLVNNRPTDNQIKLHDKANTGQEPDKK